MVVKELNLENKMANSIYLDIYCLRRELYVWSSGLKVLRRLDCLPFYKRGNFYYFQFAFLHTKPYTPHQSLSEKGSNLKGERIPFRVGPFSEGRQK